MWHKRVLPDLCRDHLDNAFIGVPLALSISHYNFFLSSSGQIYTCQLATLVVILQLHWRPIEKRIEFKILVHHDIGPLAISELIVSTDSINQ